MKKRCIKWIAHLLCISMFFSLSASTVSAEGFDEVIKSASATAEDAIVFFDKTPEISLMATETTVAYTIVSGVTKSFENLSRIDMDVVIKGYMDYAVFYKDGSIKAYYRDRNGGTISVPTEGKLIVTARNNVTCTIADDYFIVNEISEPVFIKKILNDRQTFSFTNTSLIPIKIMTTGHYRDTVVHNPDGSLKSQERDHYFNEREISAGHTVKITSRADGLEICALNHYFTAQMQDTQVFQKRLFAAGETYSFTNVSDSPYELLSNSTYRDYVIYDGAGAVINYARETYWGNATRIEIPASSTIKITSRYNGLEVCGLTDYFQVKREKNPVFKKIISAIGDTYKIKNTSDIPYELVSNSTYRDYVMHDGAGQVTNYAHDTYWGTSARITIPSASTITVTARHSGLEICALYEAFSFEKTENPVFHILNISSGETYTLTNKSDNPYYIYSGGTYRDTVIYNNSGEITSYERENYWGSASRREVPPGGRIKVTARQSTLNLYALYEAFDYEKSEIPVFQKVIVPVGETYSFTNIGNDTCKLLSNSAIKDWGLYTETGAISDYAHYVNPYALEIPSGMTIKITSHSSALELCGLSEYFTYKKEYEQLMKNVVIQSGEQYRFTNVSDKEHKISASGYNGNYVMHNSYGTEVASKTNTSLNNLLVPSGYTVTVTAANGYIDCSVLNEAFAVSNTNITDQYTVLNAEKAYEFTNLGANDYSLYWDNGYIVYDYIIYGYEDTIVDHRFGVAETNVTIPSGGKAVIVPKTNFSFRNHDDIRIKETANPVYQQTVIKPDDSYYFDNNTLLDMKLQLSYGIYDYITYNKDNSINTYVRNVQLDTLTVPAETRIAIISRDCEKTVMSLYGIFDIKKDNSKSFHHKELMPGETVRLKNLTAKDYNLLLSDAHFDYVRYNADASIKDYEHNVYYNSITVASGAYVEITALHAMTIDYLNGVFSCSDLTNPVYRYTTVNCGETLSIVNTSIRDYNAFICASMYDRITYDAAEKISSTEKEATQNYQKLTAGMNTTVTALSSTLTVISLWNHFSVTPRRYPALMRQTICENERFSFVNDYQESCTLINSGSKLSYAIYTETNSLLSAEEEVYKSSLSVPAGGRAEITAKSASITFFGAYEAFSGEDLTVKATGVVLSNNTFTLASGKQAVLRATVLPADATNKTVFWECSDTNILSIAQTGKMIAKKPGTVTVTATTEDGGFTSQCIVTISEDSETTVSVTGISVSQNSLELKINETATLAAEIIPSNATNKSVIWTSTNTSVATVANGVVTARSVGNATIIAITADGNYTETCNVLVESDKTDENILDSGEDANNISWTLYHDGSLVIEGKGEMEDYDTTYNVPWYDNRFAIKNIIIGNGITKIGSRSFYNCICLEQIHIPASVRKIGTYALRNCDAASIYGVKGSFAQSYAAEQAIPFITISGQLLKMNVETAETDSHKYFDVKLDEYGDDAIVYVGVYDKNNRLLSAKSNPLEKNDITSFSVRKSKDIEQIRIFIWEHNSLCPVTYSESYSAH